MKKRSLVKPVRNFRLNTFDDISQIKIGQRVAHFKFGVGKILQLQLKESEKRARVIFETHGEKILLLRFARLKILNN